jgi:OOP family OmpA-OmpF porin
MHIARALPFVATFVAFAAGCGGKVVFEGQTGIPIVGESVSRPKPIMKPAQSRVVFHDTHIEIKEKIQFELNKATILPESFSLLDEVAGVIKEHPEIKKLAIEGHASSDGNAQQNLLLSDARAKSVMEYLVTKGGIDKGRLTAEGFGDKKPIADNNTEEGRVKNRRVEFNVVEREGDKKPDDGKKPDDKAKDKKATTPAKAPGK